MASKRQARLHISKRPRPEGPAWVDQETFLLRARVAPRSARTYRNSLRLFADWLQYYGEAGYETTDPWPLSPESLTSQAVIKFYRWIQSHYAVGTINVHMAAIRGYLFHLDRENRLPPEIQLGEIVHETSTRRKREYIQARPAIDPDDIRQALPQIVGYYDNQPLPPEGSPYSRRLVFLRNRAIVTVLYATGISGSGLRSLNRRDVGDGLAHHVILTYRGQSRRVKLNDKVRQAIPAYLLERTDNNPALFVVHHAKARGARISENVLRKVIRRAVEDLELPSTLSIDHFRQFWSEDHAGVPFPLFSMDIVRGTRDYVERIALQANGCYREGWYDACAVMLRSLIELLIIECFEHQNITDRMKDRRGNFLMLGRLIECFQNETSWELGRQTKRSLPKLKELGNLAVHERHWSTTKEDIDRYADDIRVTIQALVYIAGFDKTG